MSSKRPHKSSSKSYASSSAEPQRPWPQRSFLFHVNDLSVNEDPNNGGLPPIHNGNGRWTPPVYSNGFGQQTTGRLFRWHEGTISAAYDCAWDWNRSAFTTGDASASLLTHYRTSTLFWCNPFTQFMTVPDDPSTFHIATAEVPRNRWWPLTFQHEPENRNLSRVQESAEEQYLAAGRGLRWISELGLDAYAHRHSPQNGGLSGNLAVVVGLVAFSCPASELDNVLLTDVAWHDSRWRGHSRGDGREDGRGVVVSIYLDPINAQGSTTDTLYALEWSSSALVKEMR